MSNRGEKGRGGVVKFQIKKQTDYIVDPKYFICFGNFRAYKNSGLNLRLSTSSGCLFSSLLFSLQAGGVAMACDKCFSDRWLMGHGWLLWWKSQTFHKTLNLPKVRKVTHTIKNPNFMAVLGDWRDFCYRLKGAKRHIYNFCIHPNIWSKKKT